MKPRRRKDWSFDDFFRDFEEEFKEIEEDMARIFEEAERLSQSGEEPKPFVYGFSVKVDPEGGPRIERFGNVPNGGPQVPDEREPLVDVIEGESDVKVVAELPGIEREDIRLDASDDVLVISVDTAARRYHKRVVLPAAVKPESAKASYKNGVLEVRLDRVEKRGNSFSVNVE